MITHSDVGNSVLIDFTHMGGRTLGGNPAIRIAGSVGTVVLTPAGNRRFPNNGANVSVSGTNTSITHRSSRQINVTINGIASAVSITANTEWRTYNLSVAQETGSAHYGSVSVAVTGTGHSQPSGGYGNYTITWGQNVRIITTPNRGFRVTHVHHHGVTWNEQTVHNNAVTYNFTAVGATGIGTRFARHTTNWNTPNPTALAQGIGGTQVTRDLPRADGMGPQDFQYSLISGALPAGLSLVNTVPGRDAVNSNIGRIQGTLTHVRVNTPSTFTIRATSNNDNVIDRTYTMLVIPMTFSVVYHAGTSPVGGGAVQGSVGGQTYSWGNALTLNTARFTVANQNWEQVGWSTNPTFTAGHHWLAHRNFATTGNNETTFAPVPSPANGFSSANPNGVHRTFGAGTSVARTNPANGDISTVTWQEVAHRQIPADYFIAPNPTSSTPINLYPIWAPVRTDLHYRLGVPPPNSETITPGSPIEFTTRTLANGGIRFTNQSFRFPADTLTTRYAVSTGAEWRQVGWTLSGSPKYLRPHSTLPDQASTTNPGGMDFAPGQVFQSTHPLFATHWGATRDIFPVWRRVITHGNVIVTFVGGPDGFMEEDLQRLEIATSMPFRVAPNGITINHASPTAEHPNDMSPFSGQITLPTFAQMTGLGLAQDPTLVFEGWFLRTSWDPDEVVPLTATNASGRYTLPSTLCTNCPTPIACPCGIWPQGIFDSVWEPYIWIEARWA
jgi:hypothetical protein